MPAQDSQDHAQQVANKKRFGEWVHGDDMSLVYQSNAEIQIPDIFATVSSMVSITLDGTGETIFMVGNCYLQDGSGSKTISAAGGGSIVWRTGTVTFSSGSSTFDVGIQDVSTSSAPAQGDGTYDVKGTYTAASALASNTTYTTDMSSGTKTITHGDLIAIGIAMTTRQAPDSVVVTMPGRVNLINLPSVTTNISGSYVANNPYGVPCAVINFDDATIGWIYGTRFLISVATVTINVDTATADEYGNIIIPKQPFLVTGASMQLDINLTANFEVILYSDPLGTPVAERTITFDAETSGTSVQNFTQFMFATPFLMKANTTYCIAFRPTTTTSNSCYAVYGITEAVKVNAPNAQAYACRRIGNSGAFSDYNGGTAKTYLMRMAVTGNHLEQGINNASYRIGI